MPPDRKPYACEQHLLVARRRVLGVRNLYGFVRFLYGFCTVLHGKVRIYAPGKQENGGPSVSNRSLNHDVASLRVWQARARRIQVLWSETGAEPAKGAAGRRRFHRQIPAARRESTSKMP